jgi:transposase
MLTHENHPNPFTDADGYQIIGIIAMGNTAQDAADTIGRSRSAFFEWMANAERDGKSAVADAYARARKSWARAKADEVVEISDDDADDADTLGRGNMAAVKRAELRIKTRQWLIERANKQEFGASQDITSKGDKIGGAPVFVLHDPAAQQAIEQVIDAVTKD